MLPFRTIVRIVPSMRRAQQEKGLEEERRRRLEKLAALGLALERHKFAFCLSVAQFARARADEGLDTADTIEWITVNCKMTKTDAEDCISIGETILKRITGSPGCGLKSGPKEECRPVWPPTHRRPRPEIQLASKTRPT